MQKDGSFCKYVRFTQHTCTNTVYVMFAQKFFQKKKEAKQHSLSDCPSDTGAAVFSLKACPGPQLNRFIRKSYSCPAIIWQKEQHSRSAVPLSSSNTLSSSWHTTCASTHKMSLFPWHKNSPFPPHRPLLLSLSTYITHHPHFSMRACFHFWCRHHPCPYLLL